jgi:hypothetical protein
MNVSKFVSLIVLIAVLATAVVPVFAQQPSPVCPETQAEWLAAIESSIGSDQQKLVNWWQINNELAYAKYGQEPMRGWGVTCFAGQSAASLGLNQGVAHIAASRFGRGCSGLSGFVVDDTINNRVFVFATMPAYHWVLADCFASGNVPYSYFVWRAALWESFDFGTNPTWEDLPAAYVANPRTSYATPADFYIDMFGDEPANRYAGE